jgi:hypothetical protein
MRSALEADATLQRGLYRAELDQWFANQKRLAIEGDQGALAQSKREIDQSRYRR